MLLKKAAWPPLQLGHLSLIHKYSQSCSLCRGVGGQLPAPTFSPRAGAGLLLRVTLARRQMDCPS